MPRPKPRDFEDAMADQDQWADDASCRDEDPRLFDTRMVNQNTHVSLDVMVAMDICADCPVMMSCLETAIRHDHKYGVWGGMVYEQRVEWAWKHQPDWLPTRLREPELAAA